LRQDFDQPLHIEDLAHELGMSVSGFHHHFKAVTAMSPLQFQKQLRLQQARRLMLGEDLDAASAAYRVGYQDASHFNREYKSLFGVPHARRATAARRNARFLWAMRETGTFDTEHGVLHATGRSPCCTDSVGLVLFMISPEKRCPYCPLLCPW
jgi:AraC-like DNA-binding protein